MTARLDITIQQGATYSQEILVGSSYDGYTAAAKVRDGFCGAVLATFTAGTVTSGKVTLSLTATQTAALVARPNHPPYERIARFGDWDLELTNSGTVVRSHEGTCKLSLEATKD